MFEVSTYLWETSSFALILSSNAPIFWRKFEDAATTPVNRAKVNR